MLSRPSFLLISAAIFIFAGPPASALTCTVSASFSQLSESQQLKVRAGEADIVVAGRYLGSSISAETSVAKFEVLRIWKGTIGWHLDLEDSLAFSDPQPYSIGRVYIVLAHSRSGHLEGNGCVINPVVKEENGKLMYPAVLGNGRTVNAKVAMPNTALERTRGR
jgi:hypothetical protein